MRRERERERLLTGVVVDSEIVEFITDSKMTLLKIENKASDVHEALKHFKETLIMRKGLSIKLDNVALADESVEILVSCKSQSTMPPLPNVLKI